MDELVRAVTEHRRVAARATEAKRLADVAVATAKASRAARNDAIRAAYQRGAAYSELQEVTGLSADGIDRIVKRRNG